MSMQSYGCGSPFNRKQNEDRLEGVDVIFLHLYFYAFILISLMSESLWLTSIIKKLCNHFYPWIGSFQLINFKVFIKIFIILIMMFKLKHTIFMGNNVLDFDKLLLFGLYEIKTWRMPYLLQGSEIYRKLAHFRILWPL
jgi:hypothetical protein